MQPNGGGANLHGLRSCTGYTTRIDDLSIRVAPPLLTPGQPLKHGVSVTDACISFAQTVPVLEGLAAAVKTRRR